MQEEGVGEVKVQSIQCNTPKRQLLERGTGKKDLERKVGPNLLAAIINGPGQQENGVTVKRHSDIL